MGTRVPFIAGNWKMHTTVLEAGELSRSIRQALARVRGVEVVLCPPFISLTVVAKTLQWSSLKVGAQNVHHEAKGAYTGEVALEMLKGICQYVIVGHSERRRHFGESDALLNSKVRAIVAAGMHPILCVGEEMEHRKAGRTDDVIRQQVRGALQGVLRPDGLVVAYEPVWAIGSGQTPTGKEAASVATLVRETLAQLYDPAFAQATRVLYGGSVTGANIGAFVREPEIDGALVGGSSLKSDDFAHIVKETARLRGGKVDATPAARRGPRPPR